MRRMAKSSYPLDTAPAQPVTKLAVHMTEEEKADLQLVADLWNAFDRARNIKRSRKWETKKVMEQLVRTGLENFWEQVGGKPETGALRKSAVQAAIDRLEEEFGEKPKK